jgi:hypothetical protein
MMDITSQAFILGMAVGMFISGVSRRVGQHLNDWADASRRRRAVAALVRRGESKKTATMAVKRMDADSLRRFEEWEATAWKDDFNRLEGKQ